MSERKSQQKKIMDNLDMLHYRFGKIEKIGCWILDKISAGAGLKFTLTEFKEECQSRGFHLTLAALEHQEMNKYVKVILKNVLYNCTLSYGTY